MDELDKRLYYELNSEIEIPSEFKRVIRETLTSNKVRKKNTHYSLTKIAVTACVTLAITVGMVYAGVTISDKIWKEPEKTVGFYSEEKEEENKITKEEQKTLMSETEAKEKAKNILKKFGYENETIKSLELAKRAEDYVIQWYIKTNSNIQISFKANRGNGFKIDFDNMEENDRNYRTTERQAIQTAKELCKKYGFEPEQYNNIKVLANATEQVKSNEFEYKNLENEAYTWNIIFNKKYDELVNIYESINILFVPEINKIIRFYVSEEKYEENPVEINKEQARDIALEAEKNIKVDYKIKEIYSDLKIEQMNGSAYLRTNDFEQYMKQKNIEYPSEEYVNYRTENRVRKVWAITIEYDLPETEIHFNRYYTYFIDATTAEIIGGDEPFLYKR